MYSKFYISLKAARLLREKEYNEETEYTIDDNGRMWLGEYRDECDFPCPTKAEAIDWLESKGVIVIAYYYKGEWLYLITPLLSEIEDKLIRKVFIRESFTTRLEAEEAAIIKACELL